MESWQFLQGGIPPEAISFCSCTKRYGRKRRYFALSDKSRARRPVRQESKLPTFLHLAPAALTLPLSRRRLDLVLFHGDPIGPARWGKGGSGLRLRFRRLRRKAGSCPRTDVRPTPCRCRPRVRRRWSAWQRRWRSRRPRRRGRSPRRSRPCPFRPCRSGGEARKVLVGRYVCHQFIQCHKIHQPFLKIQFVLLFSCHSDTGGSSRR